MPRGIVANRVKLVAILAVLTLPIGSAWAGDQGVVKKTQADDSDDTVVSEPLLQPYEPITGGYTKDSDDVGFLDVNLSLAFRLLPLKWTGPRNRLFLAMSTRFGFYWGSRPGSPVIGKSYNPKLLYRFLPSTDTQKNPSDNRIRAYRQYVDIAFAHQSNGQLIHTSEQYQQEVAEVTQPQFANNFIHRGWDYAEVAWKNTYGETGKDLAFYLDGKYFIPYGPLQGREDEYHSWENNPQGKARKTVDGLEASIQYPSSSITFQEDINGIGKQNLTLKYLTGYDTPFRYSTERAEFGFQIYSLPLAIWVQHGYMSSLAMYYQKVNSFGIEVRFESF